MHMVRDVPERRGGDGEVHIIRQVVPGSFMLSH